MKKLFFGGLLISTCIFGFSIIISEAETQTNNENIIVESETIEPLNIDKINNINDTMIVAQNNIVSEIISETEAIKVSEEDIYEIKNKEALEKQEQLKSITDNKERFIAYKNLINEYAEWIDPPESIYDVFTDDEIYLMQRCIETETFEQDFDSKVNVASVILNRIESDKFSDNVHNIIVPVQFAFGRKNISEDTKLALEYAYMFGDTTDGALYFHSLSYRSKFNGANYIFTDDAGHHFYK